MPDDHEEESGFFALYPNPDWVDERGELKERYGLSLVHLLAGAPYLAALQDRLRATAAYEASKLKLHPAHALHYTIAGLNVFRAEPPGPDEIWSAKQMACELTAGFKAPTYSFYELSISPRSTLVVRMSVMPEVIELRRKLGMPESTLERSYSNIAVIVKPLTGGELSDLMRSIKKAHPPPARLSTGWTRWIWYLIPITV